MRKRTAKQNIEFITGEPATKEEIAFYNRMYKQAKQPTPPAVRKCSCCASTPTTEAKGFHCPHCPLATPPAVEELYNSKGLKKHILSIRKDFAKHPEKYPKYDDVPSPPPSVLREGIVNKLWKYIPFARYPKDEVFRIADDILSLLREQVPEKEDGKQLPYGIVRTQRMRIDTIKTGSIEMAYEDGFGAAIDLMKERFS